MYNLYGSHIKITQFLRLSFRIVTKSLSLTVPQGILSGSKQWLINTVELFQ